MNENFLIYAGRALGFALICTLAFATGITPKELVVVSNFGYATWTIIPLVAILQAPEDFITRWAPKNLQSEP